METRAETEGPHALGSFERTAHGSHCTRCIRALPAKLVDFDASRVALGFYCLGSLDILGSVDITTATEHDGWREWIWQLQSSGVYGTAFKGSSYMTAEADALPLDVAPDYSEFDTPNLIMTYTAILTLAILRDDFSHLERPGLVKFIRSCQRDDGSFSGFPNSGEADLRPLYCAFAISSMLDDWQGVDIDGALRFIRSCESYEGGYGQSTYGEALGGTTYCALAALALLPSTYPRDPTSPIPFISPGHRAKTIRWLSQIQQGEGGFSGRTNKVADSCYCFWCGASLAMLGVGHVVDRAPLALFLDQCQFKFGGLCKVPRSHPDPYHTYMSLAALSVYPVTDDSFSEGETEEAKASWKLRSLNVLWNTTEETAEWIRGHVPRRA